MRYSTPNVSILSFSRHQTVGRQNRCRVSQYKSPSFALEYGLLKHQNPSMYLILGTVSSSVAFHVLKRRQPTDLAIIVMSSDAT
jgi:hypothetical protein